MTSSAASDADSARKRTCRVLGGDAVQHGSAAAPRQVHVEQSHVGSQRPDRGDRLVDVAGLAHHLGDVADLGAHARAHHGVVVHDQDPDHLATPDSGMRSSTSVPVPTADRGAAALAGHPGLDRVGDAARVAPQGSGWIEAASPVAYQGENLGSEPRRRQIPGALARAWPRW